MECLGTLRVVIFATLATSLYVNGATIIGAPLSGGPSHTFLMGKILQELSSRGHTVVVRIAEARGY